MDRSLYNNRNHCFIYDTYHYHSYSGGSVTNPTSIRFAKGPHRGLFSYRGNQIAKILTSFRIYKYENRTPLGCDFHIGVTRLLRRLRFRVAHYPACPSGFTFGEADLVTYDTRKAPKRGLILYRGNQIRTDDILLPKQTLYQAELHPDCSFLKGKTGSEKD